MNLTLLRFHGLIVLLATISVAGCAKSSGSVAVNGGVSYRGESLTKASLTFFPTTGRSVPVPVVDGKYETTLPPGEYVVVVTVGSEVPAGWREGQPLPKPKFTLPAEYTSRAKSTLKATVKAGQSEPIDFELK